MSNATLIADKNKLGTTVVVSFTLNGNPVRAEVSDDLALVDFLQEFQGLTGTRLCCGIGAAKRAP